MNASAEKKEKISVAVITLNEAQNIARCLTSVQWADEIVVVDSKSVDQTQQIARQFGAKVVEQEFLGHYQQKQFALEQCLHPWVLSLDADEVVSQSMKVQIIEDVLKKSEQNAAKKQPIVGYFFPRRSFYFGRWINHGGWFPDYKLRLVQKDFARWTGVNPHDQLRVQGKTKTLTGEIEHYVFRDLHHNVSTNNNYSSLSAKLLHERGKKFSFFALLFKPWVTFLRVYFFRQGFRDGLPGFIIAVGAAYSQFLKQAKVWELENMAKPPRTPSKDNTAMATTKK